MWALRIRGIEESSTYKSCLRELEALALGRDEAEAMGLSEPHAGAFAVEFARGFIRGRVKEARSRLIRLGSKTFGEPAEEVAARVTVMTDIDRLDDLIDRVFEVASWDELLSASRDESG